MTTFGKILRILVSVLILVVMIVIVVLNVRLGHRRQVIVEGGDTIHYELLKELRGLKRTLDNRADRQMQSIYPEGYVFLNAIYALAWASFLSDAAHGQYLEEGHAEIQKAWMKIDSPVGRSSFNEILSMPYGAFYNGWNAYLLGTKLRLESADMRNREEVHRFKKQCVKIAEGIQRTPFPASYAAGAWPADVIVCVASLSLHDELFEPTYKELIAKWLTQIKGRLDAYGMIPHSVDARDGTPDENARGSSMALMLIFLRDIDLPFAREQFGLFKEKFVDTRFGLTAVREYRNGESGTGDIDSGPVVMGFGGAATIVGMQTLFLFGDHDLSWRIQSAVEALAIPVESQQHKEYFFGMVPVADAFIAWSHSRIGVQPQGIAFIQFRAYSFIVFFLLSASFWILNRRHGRKQF